MIATADPYIFIEEQGEGWVRYRRMTDGRRWEVHGSCDRRGDCLIGHTIDGYGPIRDHADIADAREKLNTDRLMFDLDCPVTPEFDVCCGSDLFTYVELEPA